MENFLSTILFFNVHGGHRIVCYEPCNDVMLVEYIAPSRWCMSESMKICKLGMHAIFHKYQESI